MLVDIFYDYDEDSTKVELTQDFGEVPVGFISDRSGQCRGQCVGIIDPLDGRWLPHFVKHDWRYATHSLSRKEADKELYEGLRAAGMGYLKAKSIYEAVRCFGRNALVM